ncbi:MAG: hypothetical protein EA380_03765 [Phycisphaeraceae bacterium]|nr:MAG: hypothetical protein EA380_03765 [Phycisphaeraceae bacterium]
MYPCTRLCVGILSACAVAGIGASANAAIFTFGQITTNGPVNISGQIEVELSEVGAEVHFTVRNLGPITSSVANIYIDDAPGLLGSLLGMINGPGVNLIAGGGTGPDNLPGWGGMGITADFNAGAAAPPPGNGINPGEWATMRLSSIGSFSDIVAAMTDGSMMFGAHVISVGDAGESESIMTPTPGAAVLMGIAGLCAARRRRE